MAGSDVERDYAVSPLVGFDVPPLAHVQRVAKPISEPECARGGVGGGVSE